MALTIEVLTSKYGRVVPNTERHATALGFAITGAIELSPAFEKSLDGVTWFPFTNEFDSNLDGFSTQYILIGGFYNFYIREIGHPSNTGSVLSFNVEIDLTTQGLFPRGSSPVILTNSLNSGSNRTLTVKADKANTVIKVYSTHLDAGQEKFATFPQGYIPVAIGKSDPSGLCTITLPELRNNQRLVVSGQNNEELESLACSPITVGNSVAKAAQLEVSVVPVSLTDSGRRVKVYINNLSSASTSFSISTENNPNWGIVPEQEFELPFGRRYILVKDNVSGAIFSKSVEIFTSGEQTITNIGLRSQFNTSNNPNGNWTYGLYQNNVFTIFDNYGSRDGKMAWGKSNFRFPCVGYGDNTFPTDSESILLHAGSTEDGTGNSFGSGDSQAVARYTFPSNGTFVTSKLRVRKPTPASNPSVSGNPTTFVKYIVKHNTTILYQGVLQNQNEFRELSLNLNVQSGDTLEIIADAASEADQRSPDYDQLHVILEGQLTSSSAVTPPAPPVPILENGTGGSTSVINQGQSIIISTDDTPQWVALYKDGFFWSLVKTKLVSTKFVYEFVGGRAGVFTARSLANGVFSSSSTGNFSVRVSPAPTLSTPVISTSGSIAVGQIFKIRSSDEGKVLIYNGSTLVASYYHQGNNFELDFTPKETGTYTVRLTKGGVVSSSSNSIAVTASSVDCTPFVDKFILGTYISNAFSVKVFKLNGYTVIGVEDSSGNIALKNANFLNITEVTSVYKGMQSCFDFPKADVYSPITSSDIGNVTGYTWSISEDGQNTPYLKPTSVQTKKKYRRLFKSRCEDKEVVMAYSDTITNENLIPESAYKNDGVKYYNSSLQEDPSGTRYYYRDIEIVPGVYTVFHKVLNSPNTPISKVSVVFD